MRVYPNPLRVVKKALEPLDTKIVERITPNKTTTPYVSIAELPGAYEDTLLKNKVFYVAVNVYADKYSTSTTLAETARNMLLTSTPVILEAGYAKNIAVDEEPYYDPDIEPVGMFATLAVYRISTRGTIAK